MRVMSAAAVLVLAGLFAPAAEAAQPGATQAARSSDVSTQSTYYRRAPRVRVYRQLGPNAVRVCNDYYVQEHRPSGTVIVPRMTCYWRG